MVIDIPGINKSEGAYKSGPMKIISFIRNKKLVRKGYSNFLSHVQDVSTNIPSIESFIVAPEFPSKILGMPLYWDIVFCIDLELVTLLIHIPPIGCSN